jgi:hypothetical protein
LFCKNLFEVKQNVDWLYLMAHCRWISLHSADIAQKAKTMGLDNLSVKLKLRADEYAALGQLLANEFGLTWKQDSFPVPLDTISNTEKIITEMRRTYRFANQFRVLDQYSKAHSIIDNSNNINVAINVENQLGGTVGVQLDSLYITDELEIQKESSNGITNIAVRLENVKDTVITGLGVCKCYNGSKSFPTSLLVNLALQIENALHAKINGVRIKKFFGEVNGLRFIFAISIENFKDSDLNGLTIEEFD